MNMKTVKQKIQRMAKLIGHTRLLRLGVAGVFLISLVIPVAVEINNQKAYILSDQVKSLVGSANTNLAKKVTFDERGSQWQFNRQAYTVAQNSTSQNEEVAAALQAQIGGGGKEDKSLYSVDLPIDGQKGTRYYDANTKLSFSLRPKFKVGTGSERNGQLIYPASSDTKLVYTPKNNGMKEDIVLTKNVGNDLVFSYDLELPKYLDARLESDGSIGVYSPEPVLFGNIQYGTDYDKEKIESARASAQKTHMLFNIPAPVIVHSSSEQMKARAFFEMEGNELKLYAKGMDSLTYPVSVDPSVVVTSTSDFQSGNNEGNIEYNNSVARADVNGGAPGSFGATTSAAQSNAVAATAVYNGYIYITGGTGSPSFKDSVYYAPINADGTIGTWNATTSFNVGRYQHNMTIYNGYMYIAGGLHATSDTLCSQITSDHCDDVQYAKINADGTVGSWNYTTSLAFGRRGHAMSSYDGRLYIYAGFHAPNNTACNTSSSQYCSDIIYATVNADGTLGSWTQSTNFMITARHNVGYTLYNGYIYVVGGLNASGVVATTEFTKIQSNGDISPWASTNTYTTPRRSVSISSANGYIYLTGGYDGTTIYGDTQFAQINANGTLSTWSTAANTFANPRYGHGSAIYKNRLYVLIGYIGTSTVTSNVQYASIDTFGQISDYTTSPNQITGTNGINAGASVIMNGYIYLFGGNRSGYLSQVLRAPINNDGSIGTWSATTSMPAATGNFAMAVYNGYVYIVGGQNAGALDVVMYASFNANGSLNWTTGTPLPATNGNKSMVAYDGYLIGIQSVTGGSGAGTRLRAAPINSDGSLGTWTLQTNALNNSRTNENTIAYKGRLYVIGGLAGGSAISSVEMATLNTTNPSTAADVVGSFSNVSSMINTRESFYSHLAGDYIISYGGTSTGAVDTATVEKVKINSDGTLGTWTSIASLPSSASNGGFVYNSGRAYFVSGFLNGARTQGVRYVTVHMGGGGGTNSWTTTTSLSTQYTNGIAYHRSFAKDGYLYVIGGLDNLNASYSTVHYAPINTNGSVGTWTQTSTLNGPRYSMQLEVYGNYVYLIGGRGSGGSYLNNIEYAQINSNGTLSSWTVSPNTFTNARVNHTSAVYGNKMYVLGGSDASNFYNDVQYASINNDGTIGTWTSTTSFNAARRQHATVVYGNKIYVIGGRDASNVYLSDVQLATINANGTLGSWSYTRPLMTPRAVFSATAVNGNLYVYGGLNPGDRNDVMFAAINSDGTLNQWQYAGNFTTPRSAAGSAYYNGNLYITGGNNVSTTILSDVQYSQLDIQSRKAKYSKLIDLGAAVRIGSISRNGTVNSASSMFVKTAGAGGTYGSLQNAVTYTDGPTTCSPGTSRFAWLNVNLDDEQTFTYEGAKSELTDITVTYGSTLRPDVGERLRGGKFFRDEALNGLDTCGV